MASIPKSELQTYYLHDSPAAYSVGSIETRDELKAHLRTSQGVHKVHRQFYHISAKEMVRFILPLFDKSEHEMIRKLIHDVVGKCKICRKQARVAPKPGLHSKGLWPRQVNDIVCCDTFYLENIAAVKYYFDIVIHTRN